MIRVATFTFWIAVALVVYTYLGYPGAIALLGRLRPRPVQRGSGRPPVTLLIVAHNEAARLPAKLENCLELDYPADRLQIVVASDGSTDGTADVARGFGPKGVDVLAFDARRGKPSVLNDAVPLCRGEIVVLSDVRQMYAPDVLAALAETFHDPAVGAASGELMLRSAATAVGEGVGLYWRYEKFIRRSESRFDSTVGATGAIYALRRDLFEAIPPDTLLDDVLIPMRIVRRGFRVIFEPRAQAFDRAAETPDEEYTRKVRTIVGNLQLFRRERWVWSVRVNRLWFQTVSHKLLRLAGPFLLAAAIAANATLAGSGLLYDVALSAQGLFYLSALGGYLFGHVPVVGRWLALPYAFCLLNLTALIGVVRFIGGSQAVTWDKAADLATLDGRR
jgi:cellulose synthase/poly-beta-1,6-N-acetylglucosamine synthase-like glycosyltransferase